MQLIGQGVDLKGGGEALDECPVTLFQMSMFEYLISAYLKHTVKTYEENFDN